MYGGRKDVEWVAELLEREMLLEVKKVIAERDFNDLSTVGILRETEEDLKDMIGWNELIVLANPLSAIIAGKDLVRKYPKQKFVWYGQGIEQTVRKFERLCILTSQKIRRLETYQRMKARCQEIKITEPDPGGWKEITEKDKVEKEEIMEKVKSAQGAPIVVFDSELSFTKVREVVDWRGEVIDMEKGLLLAVKMVLGLKKWMY